MAIPTQRIKVIDSHTGGEPTRCVLEGGPDLGKGTMAERLVNFRRHHDGFRATVVNEPRGSDVLVGALLCAPVDPSSAIGVIFFNNVGYLGMCGHGTIGLMATLAYLGRIGAGTHAVETPVGLVHATLHQDGRVSIENVPSYRHRKQVAVHLPGHGTVHGDIAWGGNWFFLCQDHGQTLSMENVEALTTFTWRIRQQLERAGITGADGAEIDHIELIGPAAHSRAHGKNFVLCPGKAYDRSPCGTGTSAKVACLAEDGKLEEGQIWRLESIVGSLFEGSYRRKDGQIIPTVSGQAWIHAESTLICAADDPFRQGIRS